MREVQVVSMLEIVDNVEVIQGAEYAKLFKILDPRPLAKKRPYTYGLPKEECLDAIGKGDAVRVMIYGPKYDCGLEAWFEVLSATPDDIEGRMIKAPPGGPSRAQMLYSGSPNGLWKT